MSLTGKSPANTYKDILQIDNNNSGISASDKVIKTGDGGSSCVSISTNATLIKPASDTTGTLKVQNSGGTTKFSIDTTNSEISALNNHIHTQYAYFGIGYSDGLAFVADTHHPIPFFGVTLGSFSSQDNITFGTGTDPATTFTTADGSATDASLLVPLMWYVPDNITIDGITSMEGATMATGDTTRFHLMSYTFTSGATACLTSGTLLAHSTDQVNAGSEQPYLNTWTIDSASVSSGKVILAFFESDSVNSDYSTSVTIKYHLT